MMQRPIGSTQLVAPDCIGIPDYTLMSSFLRDPPAWEFCQHCGARMRQGHKREPGSRPGHPGFCLGDFAGTANVTVAHAEQWSSNCFAEVVRKGLAIANAAPKGRQPTAGYPRPPAPFDGPLLQLDAKGRCHIELRRRGNACLPFVRTANTKIFWPAYDWDGNALSLSADFQDNGMTLRLANMTSGSECFSMTITPDKTIAVPYRIGTIKSILPTIVSLLPSGPPRVAIRLPRKLARTFSPRSKLPGFPPCVAKAEIWDIAVTAAFASRAIPIPMFRYEAWNMASDFATIPSHWIRARRSGEKRNAT